MVRSQFLTLTLAAAIVTSAPVAVADTLFAEQKQPNSSNQTASASAARSFEALMGLVTATTPGTYVVSDNKLAPAPEEARIPVLLQADMLRGPEHTARVAIVVGGEARQAVDLRLRVWTVADNGGGRVVADADDSATQGVFRIVREFSLQPGQYDIEAVVGHAEGGAESSSLVNGQVVAVSKCRLTVRDLHDSSLAVTPVVVGDAGGSLNGADVPFIFGGTKITPAVKASFSHEGDVNFAFRIFNWTAKGQEKPDLTVDYLFYEKGTKGRHFFNKVKPQQLTAATLGRGFDPLLGSIAAGMKIPLAAFTFGDFELTVRVTDNRSKLKAESQLDFTVVH